MKKYISILLCIICVLCVAFVLLIPAYSQKAYPIAFPDASDVVSVEITLVENHNKTDTLTHNDYATISTLIKAFSDAKPTRKQSIQDAPSVETYIKVEFRPVTGTSTFFVYEKKGKYYVEQPYQGIYEMDAEQYKLLLP